MKPQDEKRTPSQQNNEGRQAGQGFKEKESRSTQNPAQNQNRPDKNKDQGLGAGKTDPSRNRF